jgi:hypothetical protein
VTKASITTATATQGSEAMTTSWIGTLAMVEET